MPLRHTLFGMPKAELEQELERRRRAHGRTLSARQARLTRLRASAAELTRSIGDLSAEISALKQEEQSLLQALAPTADAVAPPPPPTPVPDPLAELRQTLAYYRTLQTEISAGVLALIGPFLKEGTAWTSTRRSG